MMTVKWSKTDYEEVFSVKRVWFRRLCGKVVSKDTSPPMPKGYDRATLCVERPDGEIVQYTDGDFYVMNENGKTVADYHLNSQGTAGLPDPRQ